MAAIRKDRKKYRYVRYAVIVLLVLLVFSLVMVSLNTWEKHHSFFPGRDSGDGLNSTIWYHGQEYILNDNIETVLVMGLDKFENAVTGDSYVNDQQADFLFLLLLDHEKKSCAAIQINRDTMAEMNVLGVAGQKIATRTAQIALSHTYGNGRAVSCVNTVNSVSRLLYNVKIDHYISTTMDSVSVFNDLVGGVEVTVLDDFTGIDDALVKGETVTLSGEQALCYVRSRQGLEDSTNTARMVRQRQYLDALYAKTRLAVQNDDGFIAKALLKTGDYMLSDCAAFDLQNLSHKISTYSTGEIYQIEGESVRGEKYMEFYPDEDALNDLIVRLFYKPKA